MMVEMCLFVKQKTAYEMRISDWSSDGCSSDLQNHGRFINAYVGIDELLDYLQAADIYVTPYNNPAQVTSGTLSYAVALGKPVVSTPYVHAMEILDDDHCVLVGFHDSQAMAQAINALLSDDGERSALAARA